MHELRAPPPAFPWPAPAKDAAESRLPRARERKRYTAPRLKKLPASKVPVGVTVAALRPR